MPNTVRNSECADYPIGGVLGQDGVLHVRLAPLLEMMLLLA
ncbi:MULTISPECIES: hypothetical protein [Rhodococcus]|nr:MULTISPECIES: hypothetical protein [Rhodococcus]MBP1159135.1 hypothetical protein [Rhodococcus sp. PvR099]MCZ4558605.1 hypothetical protein [Rhodococcus maanshanensis]